METPQKPCIHCDPYIVDGSHYPEKAEMAFARTMSLFGIDRLADHLPRILSASTEAFLGTLFPLLIACGILSECEMEDSDSGVYNRTHVIARAAKERGIPMRVLRFLGESTAHFSMEIGGRKRFFESLPHVPSGSMLSFDIDDKGRLKSLLQDAGVPHPRGDAFSDFETAKEFTSTTIGYPVVVKPRSGSLSKHTICDVKSDEELEEAVRIAQIVSRDFLVEEYLPGNVYRVTLIDGKLVAACHREWANVTGDGVRTIRELIAKKNESPLRGPLEKRNYTLHTIRITEKTRSVLLGQGRSVEDILPHGAKAYLHDKILMTAGADIHDVTDAVHPDTVRLLEKTYAVCGSPVLGIDCIFEDIAKPHGAQACGIIEVNSIPYVDMHHYPVSGKPRDVAGALLDYCASLS